MTSPPDQAVPFKGGARQHLIMHRQTGLGHQQSQQHLALVEFGIFAVALLFNSSSVNDFKVQGRTIEEQHGQRPAQQRLRLLAGQGIQPLNPALIKLVHHPVDLLQGQLYAEVFFQATHAVAFAARIGQARHDAVE